MSSIYETGHAKNVANLLKFNQLIATFGTSYNPSNATITAAGLNTLYTTANTSLNNVNSVYNTWKNATNNREIAFLPLDKLSTQLLGALQATSAPQQTINDMVYLVRKIRGFSKKIKADASKVANPNENPIALPDPDPSANISVSISNSQQSYDQKLQHFAKLILLLQSVSSYNPNEVSLQVASLQTLLTNLTTLNNAANTAYANLKAARISRNLVFYASITGMLDRIRNSKAYIKSLYGASSQQFVAANNIHFVRVVSKKKAK
ncbi:MAG: hypothetical protein JWO32_722 [Bacteroidetes bacterium]|nr:hypothetical protein [Bacteroidota bacterium]